MRGDPQDLHRDVVWSSALQRGSNKLEAGFHWGVGLGDVSELLIPDQAPQAVGAKDQNVPLGQGKRLIRNVRHNITAGAERGGQNVPLGM